MDGHFSEIGKGSGQIIVCLQYVRRRGRLGSGQGKPHILLLLVLSRADISESTQNHFELIWIILTESGAQMLHFLTKSKAFEWHRTDE